MNISQTMVCSILCILKYVLTTYSPSAIQSTNNHLVSITPENAPDEIKMLCILW